MSDNIVNIESLGMVKDLSNIDKYEFQKDKYILTIGGIVYRKSKDGYIKMKPFITKKGYVEYVLSDANGSKKHIQAQRLIGYLFLRNPKNLPHVNHIDGNKENNNSSNLEWSTISDNNKHAYRVLGKKPWQKMKRKK